MGILFKWWFSGGTYLWIKRTSCAAVQWIILFKVLKLVFCLKREAMNNFHCIFHMRQTIFSTLFLDVRWNGALQWLTCIVNDVVNAAALPLIVGVLSVAEIIWKDCLKTCKQFMTVPHLSSLVVALLKVAEFRQLIHRLYCISCAELCW
jgi:hypothetical protein